MNFILKRVLGIAGLLYLGVVPPASASEYPAMRTFPLNDFSEQAPGSSKEIVDFCRLTCGVQFPMVGKSRGKGKGKSTNPVHLKLAEITDSAPRWNFHKYLINRDGSMTRPDDKVILARIDEFLN